MVSKLPRWAWAGGGVLAFIAGMINVVGFAGFEHQAVSHLTGTTTLLALALANFEGPAALHLAALIFSFLAGAVLSGFLIQHSTLKLGRPYGIVLILEAVLLAGAVPLLQRHLDFGMNVAACACGLQNAMVSTFSGATIRTTHLSGMLTDLGLFLGHGLRGISVDTLRLRLSLLIITAFLLGGVTGAYVFSYFRYYTLFVPSALTGLTAVAYIFGLPKGTSV